MKRQILPASFLLVLSSLTFCVAAPRLPAQSQVALRVDAAKPGRIVPDDFCGLSYEIKLLLTNATTGKHYFSPRNKPLITTFNTLGIRHLRVGGNTAERASVPIPDKADIDSFFGFVKAAGVKAIYTVRMESNNPADSAEIAKYVMHNYKKYVDCLTVGNEPDKPWKYPAYLEEWKKFTTTILSPQYAPDAKFCAPSTTQRAVEWAKNMANDVGGWDHLAYITQHFYPRANADSITNETRIVNGRAGLLSPDMYAVYQKFHDVFAPAAKAKGVGFRLEEGNSYSHGGVAGVSDTFAASLWIVDYLYWWAWNDAQGLNFHTGEKVMRGTPGPDRPNVYTAFTSTPNGLKVLPTGYGMELFNLGSHGSLVPVAVASNPDSVNLAVYGTLASGKTLCVTLLNKEYGPKGRAASVTLDAGMPLSRGDIIFMEPPNSDVTSVNGVTIGGAQITEDGKWKGKWTRLPVASKANSISVTLPAASAAVVRLRGI